MKNKVINIIQGLLLIILSSILIINLIEIGIVNNYIALVYLFILFGSGLLFTFNNKKYGKLCTYIFSITLVLFGITCRLYLTYKLNYNLMSDFKLYYDTASGIIGKGTLNTYYLSFNSYVYTYSSVLALIFKVFGSSVTVIQIFHLLCNILATFFLYKICNIKLDKSRSLLLSSLFFIMPINIIMNLLVSTEALFMALFMASIWYFIKIHNNIERKINKKNVINFMLLGLLLGITNNIRPLMPLFIVCIVIYYLIKERYSAMYKLLGILVVSFFSVNILCNMYVEHGLGTDLKSGAFGWSVVYGTNNDHCGQWNLEDSEIISDILTKDGGNKELIEYSLKRLGSNSLGDNSKLLACKYYSLWKGDFETYDFLKMIVTDNIEFAEVSLYQINNIMYIISLIGAILFVLNSLKNKKDDLLILQLFAIIYIISNLVVCVNYRYNYPLIPLLYIFSSYFLGNKYIKEKNIVKKLDSAGKRCKK